MSRIRGKDTSPEWTVRRVAHGIGYRYRLHDRKLPGSPDLVFRRFRAVIFVNGCFWHCHNCRKGRKAPKSNVSFWVEKRERNRERDREVRRKLLRMGWKVLVIWQCQCKDREAVADTLTKFLGSEEER